MLKCVTEEEGCTVSTSVSSHAVYRSTVLHMEEVTQTVIMSQKSAFTIDMLKLHCFSGKAWHWFKKS